MAKLIYSAIASLDGYVADTSGSFDWAAPDEEVHAAVNDLERAIGTYLYGPVVVGGGTRALPSGIRVDLELLGERRFASGVVQLHYRIAR